MERPQAGQGRARLRRDPPERLLRALSCVLGVWPLPRLIAHRGGGALAPENTLAGIREAAQRGYRAVEFDVMLSADGVPVLIHDETLERTTNGRGRVCDAVVRAIVATRCRQRFADEFAGEPIPRFDQALELCRSLGLAANVEIKPADRRRQRDRARRGGMGGRTRSRRYPDGPVLLFARPRCARRRRPRPICRAASCSAPRRSIGSASCGAPMPCRCTATGPGCVRIPWLPPGAAEVAAGRLYLQRPARDAQRLLDAGVSSVITDRLDRLSESASRQFVSPITKAYKRIARIRSAACGIVWSWHPDAREHQPNTQALRR